MTDATFPYELGAAQTAYLSHAVTSPRRPLLKGIPDVVATASFIPFVVSSIMNARPGLATLAAAIYGASLIAMFSISATYHSISWSPRPFALMKRLDHTMIYFFMLGGYAPVYLVILRDHGGVGFFAAATAVAALGLAKDRWWKSAPRVVTTGVYVVLGCGLLLPGEAMLDAGGPHFVLCLYGGAALYLVGALIYAFRWPNPNPNVIGWHEMFHLIGVIPGAALHFIGITTALT